MNRMSRICGMAVVLAGLMTVLVTPAGSAQISRLFSQDLTLHETTSMTGAPGGGRAGQQPSTATVYFSGNAMRRTSSDGSDMIFRFDQGKMIQVDHKQKTYSELTMEQMQQMLEKLSSTMGDNKQAMEAMKQMMGQTAGTITVTPEGAGEAIAGYATQKFVVSMGTMMEMRLWAAPDLTIPATYYDAMKLRTVKNPFIDMSKLMDEYKKIKGMVLKSENTMSMMGMKMVTKTETTSVEKGSIPASTFDVPDGYKLVAMKGMTP